MARIYSNYTDEEIVILRAESKKMGLSLSAYQKYRTLLSLSRDNSISMADLISLMKRSLLEKKPGDVFIVSSLVPNEWTKLNRSEKNTLSKTLKKIVADNPTIYAINAILPGKINQYIVKEHIYGKKCRFD